MPEENELVIPSELDLLKKRADALGVKYKSNITLETLRKKVEEELSDENTDESESTELVQKTPSDALKEMKRDALKKVRIRVTCMNPNKREWPGELLTVSNAVVGTIKQYVPFDIGEDGWHVANIVYKQLRDRQCQVFIKKKSRNGIPITEGKMIREFAIEVLPALTEKELEDLAKRQALAGAVD